MSLASLTRTEFRTELGVLPLWHAPGALESAKPVMLTITGAFATADTMSKMQQVVGDGCDCFLMHLPGNHTPPLRQANVRAYAQALEAAIARAVPDRPIVLVGVSIGALVALAVRAPNVRRVVAVEPPLVMAKLWPMLGQLAAKVAAAPKDRDLHAFVDGAFGVSASGRRDISYFDLFDGLEVPVDVVVGDRPLMPERPQETYPSFVDEPERAWLRSRPNVVLSVAPNAGHNVPFQAPMFLKAVLLAALEASVAGPLSAADEALLSRAPLAADRVLYVGRSGAAFEAAYRRQNPTAAFTAVRDLAAAPAAGYDLVLLESLQPRDMGRLGSLVDNGGAVLALATAPQAAELDRPPFSIVRMSLPATDGAAFKDQAADLWPTLRKAPGSATPALLALARKAAPGPPLFLRLATFAPTLMDVRTRLPAQSLRRDPELLVELCGSSFALTDLDYDAPKVLVLQRPGLLGAANWLTPTVRAMQAGWIVAMECDDHPQLMAEVRGEDAGPENWERFGYVHAVQTSTPQLAAAIAPYAHEVKVFPNCAFELEPCPTRPGPQRVFYGAVSRGGFAVEVARSLTSTTERFPDWEWVVIGDRGVFEALPAARKRFVDYVPYDEYLRLMGTCSLSLSPIEGRPHQETKSDVKFVEAAARGVVTLASPTIYAGTIRHRETGLIAERAEDWAPLLSEVLGDEAFRLGMARRAWSYVRQERMFAGQVAERRGWYQELWARRAELDEALMARLPGLRAALGR